MRSFYHASSHEVLDEFQYLMFLHLSLGQPDVDYLGYISIFM